MLLFFSCLCSKTKGSCKSYVDTCHTSDKGKGRGSPALANSPVQRPQPSSKKASLTTPTQAQKKHKVSLYYTKHKSSLSTAAPDAVMMDEEHEDLTQDPPLTPDSDVCNNNEPAFINEHDKKISADFKDDSHSTVEERVPAAVMFPMETPASFPDNVTVGPGPRPGLLLCRPVEKKCTEHYAEKINSEKRDASEMEVRKKLTLTFPMFNYLLLFINEKTSLYVLLSPAKRRRQRPETESTECRDWHGIRE